MARRVLLGTKNGLAERTRVYLAGDALEVDEIEGYTGSRTRVLLDEVRVITYDRRRSMATLIWITVAIFVLFGLMMVIAQDISHDYAYAVGFATGLTSPLICLFLFHAIMGVDYVTVFGKRSNAAMSFSLRKAKARRTFQLLRERVTQAQEEASARFAAEAAQGLPEAPRDFGG
jgi:hypothetical protein